SNAPKVIASLTSALGDCVHDIGAPTAKNQTISIKKDEQNIYKNSRVQLESWWSSTSYQIQALRDNPQCAAEELKTIANNKDPGLSPHFNFKTNVKTYTRRPKVAIFREQGVNGQVEMAAAFHWAGFESVDVHLNDIANGRVTLDDFSVLAACGGFSYGDVLGAGGGWAKSILCNDNLREAFKTFFARKDTLSFGVCNGCQMLSNLKEIIPGSAHWPVFKKNTSEQFEARLVSVKVNKSPSAFFTGMEGSIIPIVVSHGEGRAVFNDAKSSQQALQSNLAPLQYVDNYGNVTEAYPFNPNGSPAGITSLTSVDGRSTILMPHPERGFLTQQYSWHPSAWDDNGPWLKLFQNARQWVEENNA
ncbi:MAG: phosphoribosylformylglycinamidine synthase subunit PurQ, partial [Candidatus Saccharimonadales bacterium]